MARNPRIRPLSVCAILLAAAVTASAQAGGAGSNPELQQKLAALKESAARNQQALHQYQWTETTNISVKGKDKPPQQELCQYGPDGQIQKTPIASAQEQMPQGDSGRHGRMKEKVVAKKTEEMKDYMGQVKSLLGKYVPPDPQKMQQAYQAGKVSMNPNPGGGATEMIFKDYAQPGDQMVVSFNTGAKKIGSVKVNTYMDDPKDTVTLAVNFGTLPDGTNYAQQTTLNASAKQVQVTKTNSNYQKVSAP
jgi:hypothetical protein